MENTSLMRAQLSQNIIPLVHMIDRFGQDHVAQSRDVNKEILELFVNDKVILASQQRTY